MPLAHLTIDDAPSADLPRKLDVLADCGVPAVLFCEGRRLAEHPEPAVRAVELGYHLGNHGYSHTRASELSVETFRDELERTEALLDDVYDRAGVDRPARLFRFPYGDTGAVEEVPGAAGGDAGTADGYGHDGAGDDGTRTDGAGADGRVDRADAFQAVLADLGFVPPDPDAFAYEWYDEVAGRRDWYWTVDPKDWAADSAEALRQRIDCCVHRIEHRSPDVVLFHDGTPLDFLVTLLEEMERRGVLWRDPLSLVA